MSKLCSHRYLEKRKDEINLKEKLLLNYVPVYIVLPLFGIVAEDNKNAELEETKMRLEKLKKEACIDGVMVDVWWGIVESEAPKKYKWDGYKELFKMIMSLELKIHVIMSFHKSSENQKTIGLPNWIVQYGKANPDIYYTDRNGFPDEGCLSLGVDNVALPDDKNVNEEDKRTAIKMYSDFMERFRIEMKEFLEAGVIVAIEVGLGPNGELCYPSFPTEERKKGEKTQEKWKTPGIGEFQCYDKYLKDAYDREAREADHPVLDHLKEGFGNYNSKPEETDFFKKNGEYTTEKGKFFLEWYSSKLILHGDQILREANNIFTGLKIDLVAKVSGVHWLYNHESHGHSHAPELTAGYYNIDKKKKNEKEEEEEEEYSRDGYRPISRMLYKRNCVLNFSCLEMKAIHNILKEPSSSPEELVKTVLSRAWKEGIEVIGANTWEINAADAAERYNQVLLNARPKGRNPKGKPEYKVHSFMCLRLSETIIKEENYKRFKKFVRKMHADLDYCGEAEMYPHEVESNSAITTKEIFDASKVTEASVPIEWDEETDAKVDG